MHNDIQTYTAPSGNRDSDCTLKEEYLSQSVSTLVTLEVTSNLMQPSRVV